MSIASQCSECCTCPTATVEWDSRSASLTKAGYYENPGYESTPPKVYLSATYDGTYYVASNDKHQDISGSCVYDGLGSFTSDATQHLYGSGWSPDPQYEAIGCNIAVNYPPSFYNYAGSLAINSAILQTRTSTTENVGEFTATLADEYTTALLQVNTVAALPAWDNDFNDTAGSFANLSTDELSFSIRESRYRLRFKIPKVNTGKNLRASWVERFIAEAGVAVSSVEVYARGVYRPTVTISSAPTGGTNAAATASMSSTGTVSSLPILNPGAGYIPLITFSGGGGTGAAATAVINSSGAVTGVTITSAGTGYSSAPTVSFTNVTAPRVRATGTASVSGGLVTGVTVGTAGDFRPTVTVQAATGGGTSSTGWLATLDPATGQVSAIASGSAGDYRPTLAFTGGGGSGATATCTVDATGGIAAITLTAGGSAYTSEPTLTVTPKATGSPAADLIIHIGSETAKCAVWDGTTLGGKWVKREVANVGESLASIEVVHGGTNFATAPTLSITPPSTIGVTLSAPPPGGVQAVSSAIVNSSGQVTGFAITNAGSGYVSAPTVTVIAPVLGGTQSTGWTANLTGGAVTSITGGTTGDYEIAATVSVSAGIITGVSLTKGGAGFLTNPTITLSGGGGAGGGTVLLAAHFGTETEYADGAQPPGTLPLGYVDGVVRTYPIIGNTGSAPWKYYEIAVPSSDGTTLVANVRTVCDGSTC